MDAFVLNSGRRWDRESVDWALDRLTHRGPARALVGSRRLSLHSFGEPPRVSRTRQFHFWTWHIDAREHERLAGHLRDGRTLAHDSRFPESGLTLCHWRHPERLEISIGRDCHIPVHYARRSRSLFAAPEIKAFSNLPERDRIKRLKPGRTLTFSPTDGALRIEKLPWCFDPPTFTALSYAQSKDEVMRLLEEGMVELKRTHAAPLPLALSGGLDSSITAWLAFHAGFPCEAVTVWFDAGTERLPDDLIGARMTCEAFGFPLTELRIGPEDIEPLARRAVQVIESSQWREVETGIYVLRLITEVKGRGYDSMLTGLGGDSNFAGTFLETQLGEPFQRMMMGRRRYQFMLGRLCQLFRLRALSPLKYAPLADFTLRLPQDFLLEKLDGQWSGKKILRDIFSPRLSAPLASRLKDYPFRTAGSEALFESQWGPREEREKRYAGWLEELVPIPYIPRRSIRSHLRRRLGLIR